MFTLDIGIKDKDLPVDIFTICDEINQTLEKENSNSSGYCFLNNVRDMQFDFNTKSEAEEAEKKVKEIFIKHNLEISEQNSYINIYEETE